MTSVISYSNFLLVISLLFSTPLTRKHLQRTHSVLFFKLDSQASIALISLHTAMWGQTFWNFIKRHIVVCLPFLSKLRFETNDFFTAANNNVRNKQRPDKGFVIESWETMTTWIELSLWIRLACCLGNEGQRVCSSCGGCKIGGGGGEEEQEEDRSVEAVKRIYSQESAGGQSCISISQKQF